MQQVRKKGGSLLTAQLLLSVSQLPKLQAPRHLTSFVKPIPLSFISSILPPATTDILSGNQSIFFANLGTITFDLWPSSSNSSSILTFCCVIGNRLANVTSVIFSALSFVKDENRFLLLFLALWSHEIREELQLFLSGEYLWDIIANILEPKNTVNLSQMTGDGHESRKVFSGILAPQLMSWPDTVLRRWGSDRLSQLKANPDNNMETFYQAEVFQVDNRTMT